MATNGRRIYSGFYKRFDGEIIYVVTTATDENTGEAIIVYTSPKLAFDHKYYTSTKKSFCENIIVNGKEQPKYRRQTQMKLSDDVIEELKDIGFRGPIRKVSEDYSPPAKIRYYQSSHSYYDYARNLCKNYKEDFDLIKLCIAEKRYIGINKNDFAKAYEDVVFVRNALKNVLSEYREFFEERFVKKISIRGYAEKYGINRGSVEHIQRKLIQSLSELLCKSDETDGKKRLFIRTEPDEDEPDINIKEWLELL